MVARGLRVKSLHRLDEDARHHPKQLAVVRKPAPPRERERQHPLPQGDLGQYVFDEIGRRRAHVPTETRRAESSAFAAKPDQSTLVARPAPKSREASTKQSTVQVSARALCARAWTP